VRWPIRITNEELWKQTNEIKITKQITRRKWNRVGHTLRKEMQLRGRSWSGAHKDKGIQEGQRGVGREEALAAGKTWGEIKQSKKRMRWRYFVNALGSSGR
jgi:hypothetical protein